MTQFTEGFVDQSVIKLMKKVLITLKIIDEVQFF